MKKLLAASFLFIFCTVFISCKKTPNAAGTFTVLVEDKKYVAADRLLDDPSERGVVDAQAAAEWLVSVAAAAESLTVTAEAVSGEKSLFKAVAKAVPLLLTEMPVWIRGWKALKKFKTFYIAAGGLTPDERAIVTQKFATAFNLPFKDAETVAEAAVEAALGVINLTQVTVGVVKK